MRSTGVDITEESKQRELLAKSGLKHLKDGEAEGSLRSVLSVEEGHIDSDGNEYRLGEGAVALGSYTQASGKYAHAEGLGAKATGEQAHAEGMSTTASGNNSHAEGSGTTASGGSSHAEGAGSTASGFCSHAEGNDATASGDYSHAEGIWTEASGSGSHAEGNISKAIGVASHAAGVGTSAQGDYSHAEGNTTTAIGEASHTEGRGTTASGNYSHAEGQETTVQEAIGAHAEGYQTVVHGEVTHEDGTITKGDYAHAEGENTQAYGRGSHAEGQSTQAKAQGSHAEGNGTIANGQWSHAAGQGTTANGMFSHAEGMQSVTEKAAMASHAEGYQCVTKNNFAHAEGNVNIAEGFASHAEGGNNTAKGQFSHAEGNNNFANAMSSHAEGSNNTIAEGAYYGHAEGERNTIEGGNGVHVEGNNNKVNGQYAHAEGQNTVAEGLAAHAEGWGTKASTTGSPGAHAEGVSSKALELAAHAEGQETTASGVASHAEGYQTVVHGEVTHEDGTITKGDYAHAEGRSTHAYGYQSHAEGYATKAVGDNSHAEGAGTTAGGAQSHAEGGGSRALGASSHAEGAGSVASGEQSHSEGGGTTAGGAQSHAEGGGSQALGDNSHAEGAMSVASGDNSHAEGANSVASGDNSHAGGYGTIASHEAQTAIGKYNKDVDSLLSVGNGEYDEATKQPVRRDAFRVERDGSIVFLKDKKEVKLQEMFGCTPESILTCESADEHYIVLDVKLPEAIVDGGIMPEVLDSYLGKNIVVWVSKKETTSEDSGNLAYPGSTALINLKFSSFDGKWGFVPELILRNGMKNADLRSNYKLIVDDDGLLTFSIAVRNGSVNDIITTKLLANNFPEAKLVWHNGAGEEYNDDSKTRIKGITTGYVHAAKWAKEDCCLEADGHYLYDSELSIVSKGFSAGSGLAGQMNIDNLYLFPENQSKYTCYIDRGVEHSFGYPAILESARVTVSKVSSEQHITNANTYYVEQEISGIEPSGNSVYYKRVGLVQLDIAEANPITWYPWQQIQTADVQYENLVITDDNVANFVVGEYLLIYPSTSIVSFETTTFQCFKGIKHIADSLYSLPNGKRVTILGNWYPMQGENNSDEYCFSTYLYGYRGGTPGYSHSSNLIRVFEDFLLFNKVWYSKGY